MIRKDKVGGLGHSAVLRTLPLSGSLNKRVSGFATLRPDHLRQLLLSLIHCMKFNKNIDARVYKV